MDRALQEPTPATHKVGLLLCREGRVMKTYSSPPFCVGGNRSREFGSHLQDPGLTGSVDVLGQGGDGRSSPRI